MEPAEKNLLIELTPVIQRSLAQGIFLNVGGETPNTMTIGWGSVGIFWGKPVFTVPVRPQRFTYDLLKKEKSFVISIPVEGEMKEQRMQAGTWSGRDGDKFKRLGFTTQMGKLVGAPIIQQCKWQLECVLKSSPDMTTINTEPDIVDTMYPNRDFHTLFMGEIVACYQTKE